MIVVDDEELIRRIVADELEDEGYDVIQAENGHEALEKYSEFKPDVIVSDVKMPDMTGIEMIRELSSANSKPPPVVLVTAFADSVLEEAYAAGAQEVMGKPIEFAQLIKIVASKLVSPTERWLNNKSSQNATQLSCSFKTMSQFKNKISFGYGGLFYALESEFPKIGEFVDLNISVVDENLRLNLQACVKWVRKEVSGKDVAGIGLEITSADKEAAKVIENIMGDYDGVSYIPCS